MATFLEIRNIAVISILVVSTITIAVVKKIVKQSFGENGEIVNINILINEKIILKQPFMRILLFHLIKHFK